MPGVVVIQVARGAAGILLETMEPASVLLIAASIQFLAVAVGWTVMRTRRPAAVVP